MEDIKLNTLSLRTFDKENKKHLLFLKKLVSDTSITNRFNGMLPQLTKDSEDGILGKGFFISDEDTLVGFVEIGQFSTEEKCVYLRAAIDKDLRGQHYGKRTLEDVSDYLFQNYNKIECIKVKIAHDNTPSIRTAASCGYKWIRDDYYGLYNPYLEKSTKK